MYLYLSTGVVTRSASKLNHFQQLTLDKKSCWTLN